MKGIAIQDIQLKRGNVIPINTEVEIIIPNRVPEITFIRSQKLNINFRIKTENLQDYFKII